MFVSFFVDIALGLLLISWLYRENRISQLANTLMPAADVSTVYTTHEDSEKLVDPLLHLIVMFNSCPESESGGRSLNVRRVGINK